MKYDILGHSDDVIEVGCTGCCPHNGYNFYTDISDDPKHYVHLLFSDGTILEVRYDHEGIWRMWVVHYGTAKRTHTVGTDANIDYSDRVTLEAPELRLLSVYEVPAPKDAIRFLHDPCFEGNIVESV